MVITEKEFLHGDCLYFALAFHEKFGGTFMVLRDDAKACEPSDAKGIPVPFLHAWVALGKSLETSRFYDARGEVDPDSVLHEYGTAYITNNRLYRDVDFGVYVETKETLSNLFRGSADQREEDVRLASARQYIENNRDKFPPPGTRRQSDRKTAEIRRTAEMGLANAPKITKPENVKKAMGQHRLHVLERAAQSALPIHADSSLPAAR